LKKKVILKKKSEKKTKKKKKLGKKERKSTVDYCCNPQCFWVWGNSDFPTPFSYTSYMTRAMSRVNFFIYKKYQEKAKI
jgi:hypothetical protein